MPKQFGFVRVRGTLGDTNFYRRKGSGFLIREKANVDTEAIKTGKNYKRTRENMAEFGEAMSRTSQLVKALKVMIDPVMDRRLRTRLSSVLRKLLVTDEGNKRGERLVSGSDLTLLEDFEFNRLKNFGDALLVMPEVTVNRAAGEMTLTFPAFDPKAVLDPSEAATHFKISFGALEWKFDAKQSYAVNTETSYLPINSAIASPTVLTCEYTPNSTEVLIGIVTIDFGQVVSNEFYSLSDKRKVAGKIIKVDM